MTAAWWHTWQCGCDDAQVDRADLPERCPEHDRPITVAPGHPSTELLPDVTELGHWCPEQERP